MTILPLSPIACALVTTSILIVTFYTGRWVGIKTVMNLIEKEMNGSYDEVSKRVNASYVKTKDIRKTMRETGVSFSEVWEMVGLKDYFDFEETGED